MAEITSNNIRIKKKIAEEIINHFHTVGCGICGTKNTDICNKCTNKTSVQSMYSCSDEYALQVAEAILDGVMECLEED